MKSPNPLNSHMQRCCVASLLVLAFCYVNFQFTFHNFYVYSRDDVIRLSGITCQLRRAECFEANSRYVKCHRETSGESILIKT